MSKFKIGDRVAVYDQIRYTATVIGTSNIYNGGSPPIKGIAVCVDGKSAFTIEAHEKQCRKLKKKEPRRRIWAPPWLKNWRGNEST